MKARRFLKELSRRLAPMPKAERERTVSFYQELIEDYMEEGMTEEQAVAKLGSTEQVANGVLEEYYEKVSQATIKQGKKQKLPWAAILLVILSFPIWGSLAIALLAISFSFFVVAAAFAVASISSVVGCFILLFTGHPIHALFYAACALVCAGLAILIGMFSVWFGKCIFRLFKSLIQNLFGRRREVA